MDTKPNFGERVQTLRQTAHTLRDAADIVLAEVLHMEAAAKRFQERAGKRGQRESGARR